METIRAFIAIDIGDGIRNRLDGLQRKLKKTHAEVRWVKPANIHLTLAFLGDINAGQVDPLEKALADALQGTKPFEFQAEGIGFFGKPSRPRVIWAGMAACPPLVEVQRRTVRAVESVGIQLDGKPFAPHLTLGRVKGPGHTESLMQKIEKYKAVELGLTLVQSVELIQSTLTPCGAEYKTFKRVPLSQAGPSPAGK